MDSTTSTSISRFRFRDHNQESVDGETSEGHSSSDSSSVFSSNGDEEPELQSMTAQGVQHLCCELLELKQESNEDFQKNIFSNYSVFLAILKEMEGLQNELLGLKSQAFSQKRLIQDLRDGTSLRFLSEEAIDSMVEEIIDYAQPLPLNTLETHTEDVSEILDTLLSEHRLDDALALLEMEDEIFQDLRSSENFSSDQLMSYNSVISEKRAMLADQLTLLAKHHRVSPPELQKALLGLWQLGNCDLATQLLLEYYHSRIASGIRELQTSKAVLDCLYIQEVAKFMCSMISQAIRSFVALNGETSPYPSEMSQWIMEEIGVFAGCFKKYVGSISEISGRLSKAADAMQIAMSYFSLLEGQRIFLQSSLVEQIRPCMEDVFQTHVDHLCKVIGIFTSTDTWVLGKYSVSGILTGRDSDIIEQQPEYLFLTNSGRKCVTLIQSVAEDISPLIPLRMERTILKGIVDLFTAYIVILEKPLTGETDITKEGVSRVNLLESPTQGILILSNLSTLMQFTTSIIRNIFDSINQMNLEVENYELLIHGVYHRLKSSFLEQFICNIFSPNIDHECGPETRASLRDDSGSCDLIPSVPYLELYLELKKLQKLIEEDCIDENWLIDILKEIMDAAFEWITSKCNIWTIEKENLDDHRSDFMQFILDTQFLLEIARCGGYLSDNVKNIASGILLRLKASFAAAGLSPLSNSDDDEWLANAAVRALEKLQELHANDPQQNVNSGSKNEESSPVSSDTLIKVDRSISEESITEEKPIEKEKCVEENYNSLFNKELHGDGAMENTEYNMEEDENDSPLGDEQFVQLVQAGDSQARSI